MKKIFLSLAVMLTLTACPAPGTNGTNGSNPSPGAIGTPNSGTNTGVNGSFTTKQNYIAFLNCIKGRPEVDAQAKAAIDLQISSLNFISDAQWATVGAQFTTFSQAYTAAGCN